MIILSLVFPLLHLLGLFKRELWRFIPPLLSFISITFLLFGKNGLDWGFHVKIPVSLGVIFLYYLYRTSLQQISNVFIFKTILISLYLLLMGSKALSEIHLLFAFWLLFDKGLDNTNILLKTSYALIPILLFVLHLLLGQNSAELTDLSFLYKSNPDLYLVGHIKSLLIVALILFLFRLYYWTLTFYEAGTELSFYNVIGYFVSLSTLMKGLESFQPLLGGIILSAVLFSLLRGWLRGSLFQNYLFSVFVVAFYLPRIGVLFCLWLLLYRLWGRYKNKISLNETVALWAFEVFALLTVLTLTAVILSAMFIYLKLALIILLLTTLYMLKNNLAYKKEVAYEY